MVQYLRRRRSNIVAQGKQDASLTSVCVALGLHPPGSRHAESVRQRPALPLNSVFIRACGVKSCRTLSAWLSVRLSTQGVGQTRKTRPALPWATMFRRLQRPWYQYELVSRRSVGPRLQNVAVCQHGLNLGHCHLGLVGAILGTVLLIRPVDSPEKQ